MAVFKAGSAKHPCVHEIRVSTSDSCCWVVTVKQIMSAGGSGENSTELQQTAEVTAGHTFCFIQCDGTFLWSKFKVSQFHLITKMSKNIFSESVFPMYPWATDSEI